MSGTVIVTGIERDRKDQPRTRAVLGYSAIKQAYELLVLGNGIDSMTVRELEIVEVMAQAILKRACTEENEGMEEETETKKSEKDFDDYPAEFEVWLRKKGYSNTTVANYTRWVKSILNRHGLVSEVELREKLWNNTKWIRKNYMRAYRLYLQFLEEADSDA